MLTKELKYTVWFDNKGYYAEKQSYDWSFTRNLEDAKFYKSIQKAQKRVDHALCCQYKVNNPKIVKIEVTSDIRLRVVV